MGSSVARAREWLREQRGGAIFAASEADILALAKLLDELAYPYELPASPARVPAPQTDGHVRHTLEWHNGQTLVVFEEIGPQLAISVCGYGRGADGRARDSVTGRPIEHSLCLTYENVPVLEKALAEWRAKYPRSDG